MIFARIKLLTSHIATVVVTAVLLGGLSYSLYRDTLQNVQRKRLDYISSDVISDLNLYLDEVSAELQSLDLNSPSGKIDKSFLAREFKGVQRFFPVLSFLDVSGNELVKLVKGSGSLKTKNWGGTDIFNRAISKPNIVVFSDVRYSNELQSEVLLAAQARSEGLNPEVSGVFVAAIPLYSLGDIISSRLMEDGAFISVVDDQGRILVHPDSTRMYESIAPQSPKEKSLLKKFVSRQRGFVRTEILGSDSFISYAPLNRLKWSLLVSLPHEYFVPASYNSNSVGRDLFLVLSGIGLMTIMVLFKKFGKHVASFVTNASYILDGGLSRRCSFFFDPEASRFPRSFKFMSDKLHRSSGGRDLLSFLPLSISDPLVYIDGSDNISRVNRSTLALFGMQEKKMIGRPLASLFDKDDPLLEGEGFRDLLIDGPIRDYETRVLTSDGRLVPVLFSCALAGGDPHPDGAVIGVIKDISKLKLNKRGGAQALLEADTWGARDCLPALLRTVDDPVIVTDLEHRITLLNQSSEALLGVRLIESQPLPIEAGVKDMTLRKQLFSGTETLEVSSPPTIEIYHEGDGRGRMYQVRSTVIRNKAGRITGLASTLKAIVPDLSEPGKNSSSCKVLNLSDSNGRR